MKIIESNPYKVKTITLELTEYLEIKNNNINKIKILKLKEENKQLKNEINIRSINTTRYITMMSIFK